MNIWNLGIFSAASSFNSFQYFGDSFSPFLYASVCVCARIWALGWGVNPKLFVCRRHKLARPKDNEVKAAEGRIRTRLDASRAPLICLASLVLRPSSCVLRPASCFYPLLLCGRMKLFNLLRLFSHLPFVYTNTRQSPGRWGVWHGMARQPGAAGGRTWKRSVSPCLSLSNNGNICCDSLPIPTTPPTSPPKIPPSLNVLIAVNLKTNVCQFIFHFSQELFILLHPPKKGSASFSLPLLDSSSN